MYGGPVNLQIQAQTTPPPPAQEASDEPGGDSGVIKCVCGKGYICGLNTQNASMSLTHHCVPTPPSSLTNISPLGGFC